MQQTVKMAEQLKAQFDKGNKRKFEYGKVALHANRYKLNGIGVLYSHNVTQL